MAFRPFLIYFVLIYKKKKMENYDFGVPANLTSIVIFILENLLQLGRILLFSFTVITLSIKLFLAIFNIKLIMVFNQYSREDLYG